MEAAGGEERDGGGGEALRGEKKLREAGGRQQREEGLWRGLLGRGVSEGLQEGEQMMFAASYGREIARRDGVDETVAADAFVVAERGFILDGRRRGEIRREREAACR